MLTLVALTMALGSLRIQIHDYANVPCKMLERASESVTATYEKVGVQTEWIGLVRHGKRAVAVRRGDGASQDQIAPLTIIILTPAMAARGGIPNDVLGLAAVAADGTGRIAYVIYDRVRNVAWQAAIRDDDLLGYVMSHEIGHLLLPAGSHDTQGLMRPDWAVRELTSVDVLKLEFSQFQASQIRGAVERRHPDAPAAGLSADKRSLWIGTSC